MKKLIAAFALAIALVPLASMFVGQSKVYAATDSTERPKICFVFGPWKYCI